MIIVGITGPIGHGKTSFAHALQACEPHAVHYESAQIVGGLAQAWLATRAQLPAPDDIEAINEWLRELCPLLNKDFGVSCTFPQIKIDQADINQRPESYQKLFDFLAQPPTDNPVVSEETKEYYRPLMQWIGGYFLTKVDFGLWYKKILTLVQKDEADGVDLAVIGGLRFPEDAAILKAAGAVIAKIERPGLGEPDMTDPTERQRQSILVDTTVLNNGSLADLETCAQRLYQDIKSGQLKLEYSAAG